MTLDIFQPITKKPWKKFLPRSNREKQKRIIIILSHSMLWLCNGYVKIFLFPEKLLTWLTQGILIWVKKEVYECLQISVCSFFFNTNKSCRSTLSTESIKGLQLLICEERLRDQSVFGLEKRSWFYRKNFMLHLYYLASSAKVQAWALAHNCPYSPLIGMNLMVSACTS